MIGLVKDFLPNSSNPNFSSAHNKYITDNNHRSLAQMNKLLGIAQSIVATGFLDSHQEVTTYTTSQTNFSSSILSNNYVSPNYSFVQIYNYGNDISNNNVNDGHTDYEFISILDKPMNYLPPTFPFSDKQRKIPFLFNKPNSISKYNSNGELLNKKIFIYQDFIKINGGEFLSKMFGSKKVLSSPNATPKGVDFNNVLHHFDFANDFFLDAYNFYSGKSYLTKTTERQYKGTNFLETKTDYTYVPNSHLQRSTITTDSKGDVIESKVFYSSDYTTATETLLASKNIITPIATEIWKTKVGGTPKLMSTAVTEFGTIANGDIKPLKSYSLETDAPIDEGTIGQFNPALPIRDPNLIKLNATIQYDSKGNKVQEFTTPNNAINSVIYNNDNIPVASVTNANRDEVAYSSFEEKGEVEGGFITTQDDNFPVPPDMPIIPFYSTELSPTGSRCVNLRYPFDEIRTLIPIVKRSILSFWATSNSFKINGISPTPTLTGPTLNGWTYYQFSLPAGSPQQVITGPSKIDEIRLYPINAKMISTSFDLLNNKISDCDINNRITYYESDKLGRPSKVMDEKRNVIKTYEYHFKN